jgi:hypothetical protein
MNQESGGLPQSPDFTQLEAATASVVARMREAFVLQANAANAALADTARLRGRLRRGAFLNAVARLQGMPPGVLPVTMPPNHAAGLATAPLPAQDAAAIAKAAAAADAAVRAAVGGSEPQGGGAP